MTDNVHIFKRDHWSINYVIDFSGLSTSLLFFSIVPSASPQMFVNTTYYPRNISLMWEPPAPEERNGEIVGYNLTCWEMCNNTQFVFGTNETLTSTATTFDLLCLIPNTYYNCTLSALTSIGEGPITSQLISTSFEGTNDSIILLSIEINAPV